MPALNKVEVTGDSLLIHEFTYSLFVLLPLTGPAAPIRIIQSDSFTSVPLKEMYCVLKWRFEW